MIFSVSWFIAALAVTLATILQAITGFGTALVLVPLLVLVYDAHTAVIMTMFISICSSVALTGRVYKSILKPVLRNLFLGSIAGIPLGAFVFLHFDVMRLKIAIALVTMVFALALILGWIPRRTAGFWAEAATGACGGFLAASVGMPGPPVVLFLNHQDVPKEQFRATTTAYGILVYPIGLILLWFLQVLEKQIIWMVLSLLPFILLGQVLGCGIFPRVSQGLFQRGVPLLVMAIALYTLVTTVF
ncbi:TSUP family transporter [Desulfofundulus thermobenzoicus]|uniref:Probable membrane transporter protein n=1 Tax=Desulfofundulus thermobenzoicus TaxID=29376 RepID=A0A6N7IUD1_9FIRM|nr:sulfite exporter TauE/SafE family protein [Desulfofundulus thermobenzoicus]MQL53682.1 TSUP family transporter [Desulfofundulus thermobenzoicus]